METKRSRISSNQGLPRAKTLGATCALSTSATSRLHFPRGPSFAHEKRLHELKIRNSSHSFDVLLRILSIWLQLFIVHTAAESLRRNAPVADPRKQLFWVGDAFAAHALLVCVTLRKNDRIVLVLGPKQ